jgi:hypothetical protein
MTEEAKIKMSAACKGHPPNHTAPHTLETRAKISASLMGHSTSPETRAKISAAEMGRAKSPETRAKMSVVQTGHHLSEATKMKMSADHWKGGKQISWPKRRAKRRILGFVLLNTRFEGSEGHHINRSDVIYIPKELHRSIYHRQTDGLGMEQINALATSWLTASIGGIK